MNVIHVIFSRKTLVSQCHFSFCVEPRWCSHVVICPWAVELALWQGLVLQTFFMVAEEYPPPTATRGAWALMSPTQVDPGSPLTTPSGNRQLKPEKKEAARREEWVLTWRTSSPFVKDHVENVVISEYLRKHRTRQELQQRLKD